MGANLIHQNSDEAESQSNAEWGKVHKEPVQGSGAGCIVD
jgi:hypothetical protein